MGAGYTKSKTRKLGLSDSGTRVKTLRLIMSPATVIEVLPNGHLMVFDNQGGDPACGGTRILEIDPRTHTLRSFPGNYTFYAQERARERRQQKVGFGIPRRGHGGDR